MNNMFDFFRDAGNYDQRRVGRDDFDWGFVSTARVSDGVKPYETAIQSEEYAPPADPTKTDAMVIVESYDTADEARAGHAKWRALMIDAPPAELVDCGNGLGGMAGIIEYREVRLSSADATAKEQP